MKTYFVALLLLSITAMVGCQSLPSERSSTPAPVLDRTHATAQVPAAPSERAPVRQELSSGSESLETQESAAGPKAELHRGHGQFVRIPSNPQKSPAKTGGKITLNFEDTDLQEVVKVMLGDLLKENYVMDPLVAGTVTIQSSYPLSKDALLPVLEMLLSMNDAALVYNEGLYKIVPRANASRETLPPSVGSGANTSTKGFRTQVVPLRYISVTEVEKLLQPVLEDVLLRSDPNRNLLILAGPQRSLNRLLETISIFDVDWLKGMSMGLIPVSNVDAKKVVAELAEMFGGKSKSPLADLVRFIPIERLNSVLVITPQAEYLDEINAWIARLDRSDGAAGQGLYVYHVENGRAADLAKVLNGVFGGGLSSGAGGGFDPAELAPGLDPVNLESSPGDDASASDYKASKKSSGPSSSQSDLTLPSGSKIRIIADEIHNSLVILASPGDYRMVEMALKRLDTAPLQVLIEASIVEVALNDDLNYGVQWFFQNNSLINGLDGKVALSDGGLGIPGGGNADGVADGLQSLAPGFSYALVKGASDVRVLLNALSTKSSMNVLSSPTLMVLDNQTATINVGTEEPIPGLQRQSVANVDAPVISNVEYRDVGVILEVTPRVNASGLITMDVSQEVSRVGNTRNISGSTAPSFEQREIKSSIAVQSGNTVVLGGLIAEDTNYTNTGVPFLHDLPFIGALFGKTGDNNKRTELVVLITPRAIRSENESQQVTDEYRRKLRGLAETYDTSSTGK